MDYPVFWYRSIEKNLVLICTDTFVLRKVSILVSYNITIQKISDKLKKFFERNVKNILETLTYKFLKYFDNDFVKLMGKFASHFRNKYVWYTRRKK